MTFRTHVNIVEPPFQVEPADKLLFVGSCFAASMGKRFADNHFNATVNPFGVMYNPASILHTMTRLMPQGPDQTAQAVVVLTLGTNHVYVEKATGEIVDNCEKRPARLFCERQLTVDECVDYLRKTARLLPADTHLVLTVSPIRYAKYGFHESQLSKATLLLAVDELISSHMAEAYYFPAYEIILDELRDYRFYNSDMLHPSDQAVDYIWELICQQWLSPGSRQMISEWLPIRKSLTHRPFNPDSPAHRQFVADTQARLADFERRYGTTATCPAIAASQLTDRQNQNT